MLFISLLLNSILESAVHYLYMPPIVKYEILLGEQSSVSLSSMPDSSDISSDSLEHSS